MQQQNKLCQLPNSSGLQLTGNIANITLLVNYRKITDNKPVNTAVTD